jgi:TonB family protein
MVTTHAQLRLVLVPFWVLLFAASLSAVDQHRLRKVLQHCSDSPNVMKRNGKVIWFSSKQMNNMATNRVTPTFPLMCHCQGTVIVAVIVDSQGKVRCVHNVSGHPFLEGPALSAVTQWTFKPLIKRGDKIWFAGLLAFTFHSSGTVTY